MDGSFGCSTAELCYLFHLNPVTVKRCQAEVGSYTSYAKRPEVARRDALTSKNSCRMHQPLRTNPAMESGTAVSALRGIAAQVEFRRVWSGMAFRRLRTPPSNINPDPNIIMEASSGTLGAAFPPWPGSGARAEMVSLPASTEVRGPLSKSEEPVAALPEIERIGEPEEEQRLELASPG